MEFCKNIPIYFYRNLSENYFDNDRLCRRFFFFLLKKENSRVDSVERWWFLCCVIRAGTKLTPASQSPKQVSVQLLRQNWIKMSSFRQTEKFPFFFVIGEINWKIPWMNYCLVRFRQDEDINPSGRPAVRWIYMQNDYLVGRLSTGLGWGISSWECVHLTQFPVIFF